MSWTGAFSAWVCFVVGAVVLSTGWDREEFASAEVAEPSLEPAELPQAASRPDAASTSAIAAIDRSTGRPREKLAA
jgi:hypothetical protein